MCITTRCPTKYNNKCALLQGVPQNIIINVHYYKVSHKNISPKKYNPSFLTLCQNKEHYLKIFFYQGLSYSEKLGHV